MAAACALNFKPTRNFQLGFEFQDIAIGGQDHANIQTHLMQCSRQAVDDITQAAGFNQRISLAGCEQDFHWFCVTLDSAVEQLVEWFYLPGWRSKKMS